MESTGFVAKNTGGVGFEASPHVEIGGSGGGTTNIVGFQAGGAQNIDVAAGKGSEVATKQSQETVAILTQIRDAIEKGDKSGAEGLLAQLKQRGLDVVFRVIETAILFWLKLR